MLSLGTLLSILGLFRGVYGQIRTGCPTGWEIFQNDCYKFEKDDKLIYEEADAQCWVTGSRLLTINSHSEHTFVSNWLLAHDSLRPSLWFTSGTYHNGRVNWDDNSILDPTGTNYWTQGVPPNNDNINNNNNMKNINDNTGNNGNNGNTKNIYTPYTRIAYTIGGYSFQGFGWTVVSPSIPSAYICEIPREQTRENRILERTFEYGIAMIDSNNIETGPIINKEPESVVIYRGTPSVYITCGVTGTPAPTFSWKRNLKEQITSETDSRYTTSGNRFTIQGPESQKDAGKYQCVTENKFGKVLSNPADLIFGYLQAFSPVKPEDVRANKFEGTRISCQAPTAYPDVRYSWYQLSQGEMMPIFQDHDYMFLSYSGYLYFSEVQPTDNRKYFCMVTLSASSKYREAINQPPIRTSLGVWLVVTGTEHGTFKPFIYTHVFPSPALRGSRIRMECIAYGSLPLTYAWYREDGRPFQKGTKLSDLNRVLTIEKADIEAEGNYICNVRGRRDVTSKTVNLIIETRPYFPFGIGDKFVDPGQTLHWRCKAVARPAAVYTWYKNGEPITNIPGEIEVRGNFLMIKEVDKVRDSGMYQCGATNIHGTTFSNGQLKVLSFPPNFNRHPFPPMTQMPLGGNFTIPCQVEGAPLPEVVWMKNGGILSMMPGDMGGRIGMSIENDLIFTNIEYSDAGIYTCKGSNTNGEATNTTRVTVIRGISIMRGPTNTQVLVNRTAFLFCQASYDSLAFDLTYQWKFNGHLINMHISPHFIQSKKTDLDGLYISQAQFDHSGVFTCEARTPIHTVSASAKLTVLGPPAAPAGAYVESTSVTSHSVRLIWTVTAHMAHGSPITKYDIEAEVGFYPNQWKSIATDVMDHIAKIDGINFGLRDDQRSTIVEGLLPNIDYRFRVRSTNIYGKSPDTSKPSSSVKTPARAPVVAVKRVRGIDDAKVGTLTIVWDPLDISERAGPDVGYNIYFRKKDDPKDYFKATVFGEEAFEYTHLVGEKNFYLPYAVKIGAFNKHGAGPNTTEHIVMSAEGMPVAAVLMGDCDNYNGTAFSMSWTPVDDNRVTMKGRLKGYRIRYWHIDFPNFVTYRDLYGQHDSTVIIGLEDNTNYWASVQVMNYAGVGPVGEIRLAETFHLPPQLFPRHVKVFSHTKHSVRVKWQGVSTAFDEETLQGYIIRVWKIQEDIRTAVDTVVEKENEAIVDNLQAHTVYVLRVLGWSIGGEGALSPHVYFTVDGGNIPFDPVTTQYCFDVTRDKCDSGVSIQMSFLAIIFMCICHYIFS